MAGKNKLSNETGLGDKKTSSNAFNKATTVGEFVSEMDTPAGLLKGAQLLLRDFNEPVPAAKFLNGLKAMGNINLSPISIEMKSISQDLVNRSMPYLLNDAALDRGEMIRILADVGNARTPSSPAPQLVKQAGDMIKEFGVKDNDGSLAAGMAKTAVQAAIGVQGAKMILTDPLMGDVAKDALARENLGIGLGLKP